MSHEQRIKEGMKAYNWRTFNVRKTECQKADTDYSMVRYKCKGRKQNAIKIANDINPQ